MAEHELLTLRDFEDSAGPECISLEIAWPVDIYECLSSKVIPRELDPLAETVLRLISIGYTSKKELARTLAISGQLVEQIMANLVEERKYIATDGLRLTDKGQSYLSTGTTEPCSDEKVFGHMFYSIPNKELMPAFYPGQLPNSIWIDDGIWAIQCQSSEPLDRFCPQFSQAYKQYAMIARNQANDQESEYHFIRSDLEEVPFEGIEDTSGENASADSGIESQSQKYVRVLDSARRRAFIKTRILFSREDPEKFAVQSPFRKNVTTWYTSKILWMRENWVSVQGTQDQQCLLDVLLQKTADRFYVEFPELRSTDFPLWVRIEYPNLNKIKLLAEMVETSFKKVFNLITLYDHGQKVSKNDIITAYSRLLETLFNNYIYMVKNGHKIPDQLPQNDKAARSRISTIFSHFNIDSCRATQNNLYRQLSKMRRPANTIRWISILDRYFFLVLEAYFYGQTPFRKILRNEAGPGFIRVLDNLIDIRNRYGPHSSGTVEPEVPEEIFDQYKTEMLWAINLLLDAIYEVERNDGKSES